MSCHHLVSILAGTRQTTTAPARDSSQDLRQVARTLCVLGTWHRHREPYTGLVNSAQKRYQERIDKRAEHIFAAPDRTRQPRITSACEPGLVDQFAGRRILV